MPDQANDLRRLMIERTQPRAVCPAGRPHRIVVAGGKGGVGTSTIAMNLALALADAGHATLLVDADPRGDLALLCGIEHRHTLDDLLAARRSVAEVVAEGPGGIHIVAGSRGWDELGNGAATIADRITEVLDNGDVNADLVVIDAGNTTSPTVRRLWQVADAAVMVAMPDAASVVGAYESLKVLTSSDAIYLLVNRATPTVAAMVYNRVARACRRFLDVRLARGVYAPSVRQSQNGSRKLNIRSITVDKKREPSAADVLLRWKRRANFDGRGAKSPWFDSTPESRPFACRTKEMDFLQQVP